MGLEEITAEAAMVFREIRDIPYTVGGEGNCSKKHGLLQTKLSKLGYMTKIRISNFDWKSLPFPGDIKDSLGDNSIEPHMNILYGLGPYRGIADLTFDSALKCADFKVYDWDGKLSTGATVKEIGAARVYHPIVLRARGIASSAVDLALNLVHIYRNEATEQERWAKNREMINNYLDSIRKQ